MKKLIRVILSTTICFGFFLCFHTFGMKSVSIKGVLLYFCKFSDNKTNGTQYWNGQVALSTVVSDHFRLSVLKSLWSANSDALRLFSTSNVSNRRIIYPKIISRKIEKQWEQSCQLIYECTYSTAYRLPFFSKVGKHCIYGLFVGSKTQFD